VVYLYFSEACQNGNHKACNGGFRAPKGVMGGSVCTCTCHRQVEQTTTSGSGDMSYYDFRKDWTRYENKSL
jgi:hypothetical protein